MMWTHERHGGLVLVAALALLGACNRADRVAADSTLDTAGARVAAPADSLVGRVAGREYTNAELLGLIDAYNDAEIEMGQMAQPRATEKEVRDYAQQIVTDHKALKTEVSKAAQQGTITPTVPDDDEDIRKDHQDAMRDLPGKTKGKEFDEAFLEHEIKMHKNVLDEIDDALGRNRNPEIRPLLEQARAGVQGHLQRAEELEKKFGV
jgi:putative membrane protein